MKRNFIHMIASSCGSLLPQKASNFSRSSGVFNVFVEFSNEINELWLNDDDYNDDDDDVGNFRHGFSFNALQYDDDAPRGLARSELLPIVDYKAR